MKNESCLRKILERFKNKEITKDEALDGIEAVFSTNKELKLGDYDYIDDYSSYFQNIPEDIMKALFDSFSER